MSRELSELKEIVSFEWLREACRGKFSEAKGRPSIAPETLGAMLLLGFWYDIPSDRELCEECEDRLSFREFIGLSDEDEVPVHSSLTHWRKRLGREVFQEFLRRSIETAVQTGLSPGRCRMFDSTLVKAQAAVHGKASVDLDPVRDANDYLDALGMWDDLEEDVQASAQIPKKGRKGCAGIVAVSSHDLDARLLSRRGKKTDFYHKCHFEFDASSGLVLDADASHCHDAVKMVEMLEREDYPFDTVAGDTGYFTGSSQRWLKEKGICSHISVRDNSNKSGRVFGIDAFCYVAEADEYICPAGKKLTYQGKSSSGERRYASQRDSCTVCEMRDYCFQAGRIGTRRQLTLGPERELVEEAKRNNLSSRYRRLRIKRSIVCEGSIGSMKGHGGLGRARWLGQESMAIQALLAGAVLNLKKVLKLLKKQKEAAEAAKSVVSAVLAGLIPSHAWNRRQIRPQWLVIPLWPRIDFFGV